MADQQPIDDVLLSKFLAGKTDPVESARVQQWLLLEAADLDTLSEEDVSRLRQHRYSKGSFVQARIIRQSVSQKFRLRNRTSHLAARIEPVIQSFTYQRVEDRTGVNQSVGLMVICLLLLTSIGWLLYRLHVMGEDHPAAHQVTLTANDKRISKTLPDGTRVLLNNHSTLQYTPTFSKDRRKVNLRGEAFFNVIPDSARPFSVEVRNCFVEASGSAFTVRTYDKGVRVAVQTGSVRLISGHRGVLLSKDQQATVEGVAQLSPGN